MYYVRVLVGETSFHGNEALTYAAPQVLAPGSLVRVPLRDKVVLGTVVDLTKKPAFFTKEVLEISKLPPLPRQSLALLEWMRDYYPAPLGVIAQLFLPRSMPKETSYAPLPPLPVDELPPLTDEQITVLEKIKPQGLHLLHGDTGTGKTRVYIELAKKQLMRDASTLILSPEIGLTSQLVENFRSVFGERVLLVHSELSETVRRKTWATILSSNEPRIIIGARSALFSPLRHLGLIVVDESHEPAYKQDQAPYYHATPVAARLAQLHKAVLILGSATPLVSDYFISQQKNRPILRMSQTATIRQESTRHRTHIVDLRDKKCFSKSPFLSTPLVEASEQALLAKEQVLFFLNRRGTARLIFCEQCGWQALCPHCDLPVVYHGDFHAVRCHNCTYTAPSPVSCPHCNNPSIVFTSIGTKALEDEIHRLFPDAAIRRFDTDNTRKEKIQAHYQAIREGDVDILVGTQTLAKGLDLPKLGVVGVIAADTGLFFPDFSAQERTYQLLSQVLGRVGRGHRNTQAFIQTYAPNSSLLRAVLAKDWSNFYINEMQERKKFLFPPFCYLLKLTCRRASQKVAENAAEALAKMLKKQHAGLIIEGPAPAFHERVQNKFQWQLIVKAKNRTSLLQVIHNLPANWSYDIDPLNLL